MAGAETVAARIGRGVSALCNASGRATGIATAGSTTGAGAAIDRRRRGGVFDAGGRRAWSGEDARHQDLAGAYAYRSARRAARQGGRAVRVAGLCHAVACRGGWAGSGAGDADRPWGWSTGDRVGWNGRAAVAADPAIRVSRLGCNRCVAPLVLRAPAIGARHPPPRHPSESWDLVPEASVICFERDPSVR